MVTAHTMSTTGYQMPYIMQQPVFESIAPQNPQESLVGIKRKPEEDLPVAGPISSHSEDDSVALLPRHTKVRILGNNRTKISLIGQVATVKRAVGLGGWHWLTLGNGEEIKLQRNALAVLEYPTGHEHDTSASDDDEQHHHPHSPYQRKSPHPDAKYYKRPRPTPFTAVDYNGQRRPLARLPGSTQTRINFGKLGNASLRRYGDFYQLPETTSTGVTREDLLNAVSDHFTCQEVDEGEVIAHFLAAARRHASGLPPLPRV